MEKQEDIRINGFAQLIEMLKVADQEFCESLLNRIAKEDAHLAQNIIQQLRASF